MELNETPENYFADVEQAAFAPANVVHGIGYSPGQDAPGAALLLPDAHRYRLGVNYEQIPVNAPKVEVNHYNKDGVMRFFRRRQRQLRCLLRPEQVRRPRGQERQEPPLEDFRRRWRSTIAIGNDDFSQPRALFHLFDDDKKARLFANYAAAMGGVPDEIVGRQSGSSIRSSPTTARRARGGQQGEAGDAANAISVYDETPQHAAG